MSLPLMPKATAVWLVENTSLSFEQISQFCGLHILEIQAMADGEVGIGLQGIDPVLNGQVSLAEIERCQAEPSATLTLLNNQLPEPSKMIGMRYTPISKRQDKPDAIAWLVKTWPDLSDGQIQKLIGTTKKHHPSGAQPHPLECHQYQTAPSRDFGFVQPGRTRSRGWPARGRSPSRRDREINAKYWQCQCRRGDERTRFRFPRLCSVVYVLEPVSILNLAISTTYS